MSEKKYYRKIVNLDDIIIPEQRMRAEQDEQSDEVGKGSVEEIGLIHDISVREVDGKFVLISGESRLRWLKAAGYKEYEVKVWNVDEATAKAIEATENIGRGYTSIQDYYNRIKELKEKYGWSNEKIQKVLAPPKYVLDNIDFLDSCLPELRDAVLTGQISLSAAKELQKFKDEKVILNYLSQAIENKWSVEDIVNVRKRAEEYVEMWKKRLELLKQQEEALSATDICFICRKRVEQADLCYVPICRDEKERIAALISSIEYQLHKEFKDMTDKDMIYLKIEEVKRPKNEFLKKEENKENSEKKQENVRKE
ncbi:MAG: ParB N-terminal domain-containing protein [Candidatus Methanomethylicaceae archaeon]